MRTPSVTMAPFTGFSANVSTMCPNKKGDLNCDRDKAIVRYVLMKNVCILFDIRYVTMFPCVTYQY